MIELLKNQLLKMSHDGSWVFGAVGGGISFVFPDWITSKKLGIEHAVVIGILLAVFLMEWAVGSSLAKLSTSKKKNSTTLIDSAIRDFIILVICMIAYGFDYLLGTGSIIFCLFTFAFIYHNFYSLMANIAVLGWEDKFPMWLIKWLEDEIEVKKEKYFPTNHLPKKSNNWYCQVGSYGDSVDTRGTVDIGYEVKLEEGSIATPYQPNLLDAPYYLSKTLLGENIADPAVQFPIKTSAYNVYQKDMKEPFTAGQTYTLTIKATKASTQTFMVYNEGIGDFYYGNLKTIEGLSDMWLLTFTPQKVSATFPKRLTIIQYPQSTLGACQIDWLKIEKGDTRTPNIQQYKYFGEGLKDSNDPNGYSWDITPEYAEKGLNDSVSLTESETILGLKNFAEGLQSSGVNVAVEYAKATDTDKYTKHGAIYLGGCAWLAWETLTFQKADGYAKGSYIRLGADGNASFTYSDVPNIFAGYLWLGGTCQPDYTDGGFGSYHITVENNFDDARKPIVRFVDSPTTPVKKLAVRGFALVFAPAPTENSRVLK
ncbi:phage holin family protein [Enterococcus durans]|uniref:phage holin family protein n=1 Tax=Enterococcus durans TaxID=53345 RepID=UPI0011BD9FA0|nr:phage holin family protein [Enterococcus durans]